MAQINGKRSGQFFMIALSTALIASCGGRSPQKTGLLELRVPAFKLGGLIPWRYTCDGKDISPALKWSGVPTNAKSLVLIMEDISIPGGSRPFIHWTLYNIPANAAGLPEQVPKLAVLSDGSRQTRNTSLSIGYIGPCPGAETHIYLFTLYALDIRLQEEVLSAGKVQSLIEGHILQKAEYHGKYK